MYATLAGNGLEPVGNAKHGFGTAEKEHAVIGHQFADAFKNLALGLLFEVDRHIAVRCHEAARSIGAVMCLWVH